MVVSCADAVCPRRLEIRCAGKKETSKLLINLKQTKYKHNLSDIIKAHSNSVNFPLRTLVL